MLAFVWLGEVFITGAFFGAMGVYIYFYSEITRPPHTPRQR